MNSKHIFDYVKKLEEENARLRGELEHTKSLLVKEVGVDASAFLSASYPGDPSFSVKEYMTLKFIQTIIGNGTVWTVDAKTKHHLLCAALITVPVDYKPTLDLETRAVHFIESCFRQWLSADADFPTSESSMDEIRKTLPGNGRFIL